jgi:Zn-finger protein
MRWSRGGKNTTDDFSRIDVRYLSRNGILRQGSSPTIRWTRGGNDAGAVGVRATFDSVVLSHRRKPPGSDEWICEQYPIYLDWSPCNYGGKRPCFLCPARGCGRRVAVLHGGGIFACRQCHQLAYQSQRDEKYERALSRAQAIRLPSRSNVVSIPPLIRANCSS